MFSELFATAPDAMIVVDRHGRIIRANPQAERLFGFSEEELRGQPVEILIPEQARQAHRLHRAGYAANPRQRPMGTGQELIGLKRDGQQFPVEIALSPIHTTAEQMFVASIRDISETQRARQALLRAKYDTAIAQIGRELLGAANFDLVVEPTLQLVVATLGIEAAAIVVKNEQTAQMSTRAAHGVSETILNDLPWSLALRNLGSRAAGTPDSASRGPLINDPVLADFGINSTVVFPLFDNEQPTAALLVMSREWRDFDRDSIHFLESVTNLLAAALQRIRSEDQLAHSQRLEAVGQLTGGVAHDFNNLLTIIAGNLQILESHFAEDHADREIIASALRAASRGAELTRKLLVFARRQRLSPRACDPKLFLSDLGAMLQRTLGEAIEVRVEYPSDVPCVFADPAHLDSALVNLALNSRDAMPRGGILTISAATRSVDTYDSANELKPGDYVVFSVRDTGMGMTPDVLARAFEPFFTTKEQGKGSGLGLSMVYGFVKQSGGHLTVDSRLGYGTSISLHLPTIARPAANDTVASKPAGGRETILVVEDEPDVCRIAVAFLRSLGYSVQAVSSAEDALKVVAGSPHIDLIFSDLALGPGMTGKELAQEIHRERPRFPILLTSGYESSPDSGDTGMPYEVLPKPYLRDELALAIRRTLEKWHGAQERASPTDALRQAGTAESPQPGARNS